MSRYNVLATERWVVVGLTKELVGWESASWCRIMTFWLTSYEKISSVSSWVVGGEGMSLCRWETWISKEVRDVLQFGQQLMGDWSIIP